MKNVIFVAPYFMDATARFIDAASRVHDARVGLVSCAPVSNLQPGVRRRLAAHFAVGDLSTEQLLHGVQKIGSEFGGIDTIMGMLEQIQVPLGEIRDRLGIPGMSAAVAKNFRDKSVMKTVLRNAGVPCARHVLAESAETAWSFAEEIGFPLVVKPPDGAGAQGTFRCADSEQLGASLNHLRVSRESPVVLEEFIQGEEHSFDSICLNGQVLWSSISHYFPGPLEVVREPWIQWCVMIPREVDSPRYANIHQIAQAALSALGMQTGLSHMEWFRREDGTLAVSEVGCRPPGAQFTSLISWAHDFDLYRAWAEVLIHGRFEVPERRYAAGAAYLRGMGIGKVAEVQGLDAIAKSLGDVVVEAKLPQPGQSPKGGYEGEGHIIVRHPETEVVKEALRRIISTVQVRCS